MAHMHMPQATWHMRMPRAHVSLARTPFAHEPTMRDGTSGASGALQCRDPMYVQLGAAVEAAARRHPD